MFDNDANNLDHNSIVVEATFQSVNDQAANQRVGGDIILSSEVYTFLELDLADLAGSPISVRIIIHNSHYQHNSSRYKYSNIKEQFSICKNFEESGVIRFHCCEN